MISRTRLSYIHTAIGADALFVLLFLVVLVSAASAQGVPASIIGRVTDESGGVLPGVTVTATSPALQVQQVVAITDAQGEYRLTPLPIGRYTIEYALPGFGTLRQENVQLTVGFVAKVDHVMKVATIAETVTVAGASPLVDVVSTAVRTDLSGEAMAVLPTSRDGLKVYMGQTPGVRTNFAVGAEGGGDAMQFRVYGQRSEAWDMLEGVMMSRSIAGSSSGTHIDFASVEGVRIQTVGNNAEMPRRGILLDAVMKSGGNQFHGMGEFIYQNSGLQSNNVDDKLKAQGIRSGGKLDVSRKSSGGLGGKIIENKLWFYVGASHKRFDVETLDAYHPDGRPIIAEFLQKFHLEKLSYQMTPGNRIVGFNHWGYDKELRGASRFIPAESRESTDWDFTTSKVEWQAVRGSSVVTSLQYGQWIANGRYDALTDKPATLDISTLMRTGAHISDGRRSIYERRHAKAVLSWYRPDRLGSHDFKVGFDYLLGGFNDWSRNRPSGNYQLQFNNGAPFQLQTSNNPTRPKNFDSYSGIYVQDAWTIARRLTLNVGIRAEHDAAYIPEQCREAGPFAAAACYPRIELPVWNSVAPRAHVAYDVFGNGKTAIKGGYGRFNHLREINPEVSGLNAHNAATSTWRWRDLNGNRDYDAGEVNLDPNGPDFLSTTGGIAVNALNPNEKQPKADEFSASVERELMPNLGVRITGIYSRNFNAYRRDLVRRPYGAYNIPITNRDPGPDGLAGTPDDGGLITYFDFPAEFRGAAFETGMLINDPNADHTYRTIEVALARRLSEGWLFTTSYSATKSNIPFGPSQPALAFNPNAEIFVANQTWEWTGKASGAYTFPYGVLASANFEHRSGEPGARQVLFTGGIQTPSIVLNVEPVGTRRLPSTNLLDIAAEKRFSLRPGHSLNIRVNVFNALNINTARAWTLRSGPNFLIPTSIVAPRIAQFTTSYTF